MNHAPTNCRISVNTVRLSTLFIIIIIIIITSPRSKPARCCFRSPVFVCLSVTLFVIKLPRSGSSLVVELSALIDNDTGITPIDLRPNFGHNQVLKFVEPKKPPSSEYGQSKQGEVCHALHCLLLVLVVVIIVEQEAQLSQRGRAMLRVIECFA